MTSAFQESLFLPEYKSDWKPPTDFPRWWGAKSVTIDCETRDPELSDKGPGWHKKDGGEVVGIGIEVDGDSRYYPIAHHAGGNLDPDSVLRWVADVAKADSEKVFHNASYDIGWLKHAGVKVSGTIFDTQIGAALLDEYRYGYSLDHCAFDYAGIRKDETELFEAAKLFGIKPEPIEVKSNIWRLPAQAVGYYGEGDVTATRALANKLRPLLKDQRLTELFQLECELVPYLVKMRQRGVLIDQDAAAQLKIQLSQALIAGHKQQESDWGRIVGPKSNAKIASVCQQHHIDYPLTAEGNPSFVKDWLAVQTHPFLVQIRELREIQTYQSLLNSIIYQYMTPEGRVHCQFHNMKSDEGGTVTGRFSSSLPSLQQVPKHDPVWGKAFRALFTAEPGARWLSADYSQQEYKLIVHYSRKLRLEGAKQATQMYEKKGANFHQIVADMMGQPDEYDKMKNVNFASAYGAGKGKVGAMVGVSEDEAADLLVEYHKKVPFVGKLQEACANKAASRGWIRTIGGRLCRFPYWEPMNARRMDPLPTPIRSRDEAVKAWGNRIVRAWLHKSMNKLIQAGGADITKKAMLECCKAGWLPSLTVHDELDGPVTKRSQCVRIQEIMEHTTPTRPGMVAEIGVGKNWAEAH